MCNVDTVKMELNRSSQIDNNMQNNILNPIPSLSLSISCFAPKRYNSD